MSYFYSQEALRDPSGFYSQLHDRQEPLFRVDDVYGMGSAWVALRYDDATAILKDPRFVKDWKKFTATPAADPSSSGSQSVADLLAWLMNMPNMLTVDPPDHTRLRRLTAHAFTPRMIEGLRPRIRQIADELLDAVKDNGRMDLIADYAYPLPITVISEMLGVPAADRNQFRAWSETIMIAAVDQSRLSAAIVALDAFVRYIKSLLEDKRKHPGDDLTSGLVRAQEEGDKLSESELIAMIWLLITAGHETTVNLIGNGILAMLQNPGQMNLLRDNPSLLPSAVEELLRYAGPIIVASRFVDEDVQMHGKLIHKGEMVLVSLTAANLDPRRFREPQSMDITREENEHLAFGKGIHHCFGAPLARLEGQIAIGTLLERLPELSLAESEQHVWAYSKFRALKSLPVTF